MSISETVDFAKNLIAQSRELRSSKALDLAKANFLLGSMERTSLVLERMSGYGGFDEPYEPLDNADLYDFHNKLYLTVLDPLLSEEEKLLNAVARLRRRK